jgi:tRNA (cytidine/uridine-2'-O-)-methyltransferase
VFKVMFFSPRIAPNTGNAIRMVAATGCELHLVEPLGFELSEPRLRRAGLDYHDLASVTVHPNLAAAGRHRADAGACLHRARDDAVRRHRLPAGDVVMLAQNHRWMRHAGRPAHHLTGASRCWQAGAR